MVPIAVGRSLVLSVERLFSVALWRCVSRAVALSDAGPLMRNGKIR